MANALTARRALLPSLEFFKLMGMGAAVIVPALYLLIAGQWRLLVMLICLGGLWIAWRINRTLAICLNFAYLLLLGDLRRIVTTFAGESGTDPLLLVGALFAILIAVPLFIKLRARETLSKAMLVLLGIMLLEVVNPKQGSLLVGITAGLFYIVPMLWFWIGRAYATERMMSDLLFKVFLPLSTVAAVLGLYQTYVGFLPWEQAWIDQAIASGYMSLFLGAGQVRAFGYSVNGVEFTNILCLASAVMGPLILQKRFLYLPLLPLLLFGMFLGASRTPIVKILFAWAGLWAVSNYKRNPTLVLPRFIMALVLGMVGVGYTASQAASSEGQITSKSSKSDYATNHVVQGLANPLDSKSSTAGAHVGMVGGGILAGITNPVGYGLGATTLAAGKFGGEAGESGVGSSELDFSDVFISTGVVGGVCYTVVIFFAFKYMLEYLTYGKKNLTYPVVCLMLSGLGGYLGQGLYALAPLLCFLIGFLARQHEVYSAAQKEAAALLSVSTEGPSAHA